MVRQIKRGRGSMKTVYWSLVGMASARLVSLHPVMADTIWDRFSTIMKDVYGQPVGLSTIVAVTAAAIALIVRMISRNQRAVDEATSWLKRIVVTWISSIVSQMMDAVSGLFLQELGTDMTVMEEYFPFVTKAFSVMQYMVWAVLFLITVWQFFRVFGGSITEAENPWVLLARGSKPGTLPAGIPGLHEAPDVGGDRPDIHYGLQSCVSVCHAGHGGTHASIRAGAAKSSGEKAGTQEKPLQFGKAAGGVLISFYLLIKI